jgi:hypothetical protein
VKSFLWECQIQRDTSLQLSSSQYFVPHRPRFSPRSHRISVSLCWLRAQRTPQSASEIPRSHYANCRPYLSALLVVQIGVLTCRMLLLLQSEAHTSCGVHFRAICAGGRLKPQVMSRLCYHNASWSSSKDILSIKGRLRTMYNTSILPQPTCLAISDTSMQIE